MPPNSLTPKEDAEGIAICLILGFLGAAFAWTSYWDSVDNLKRIKDAPSPSISGLRSLLKSCNAESEDNGEGLLVVVRGRVITSSSPSRALVAPRSGKRAVVIESIQKSLYNEWKNIQSIRDLPSNVAKLWKEHWTTSLSSVPFILVEDGHSPKSGFVNVSIIGSDHQLPLTTVYEHTHNERDGSWFVRGDGFQAKYMEEEKILPVGSVITVIGICRTRDGALEIRPCTNLPYFLSYYTKDQIVQFLTNRSEDRFVLGIVVGAIAIGLFACSISWAKGRQRRGGNGQAGNAPNH